MIKFIKSIWGMFLGNDGIVSTTKLFSIVGYIAFLIVSGLLLYQAPEKFDYNLFAILTAGSGTGLRIFDKYLNLKGGGQNECKS